MLCLFRIFLKAFSQRFAVFLAGQDPPALRSCFPKLKDRLTDEDQVGLLNVEHVEPLRVCSLLL